LLNDDDEITVIGYDTEPVDIIGPFTGRERARFLPQILSMAPGGGGIYVKESLEEARRVLDGARNLNQFVILLADGNDAERQEGARELARQMNADRIILSAVSIGDGDDVPFLKDMARIGGGRFHLTDKAANLPTIFAEETALAQRNYIVEQDFFPTQGAASQILSGIEALPQLQGYVATTAKPAAQVVLQASDSDPLLATWQYGLGRVVAFTSDATGRWAKSWVAWSEFPRFWAQTVRWTIVERPDTGVDARVTQRADEALIEVDLPAARTDDDVRLNATLIDSAGNSTQVPLVQTAPGHYEAPAYLDQPGAYFVRIESTAPVTNSVAPSDTIRIERTLTWAKPYSAEYSPVDVGGSDAMQAWAALGGGARLTDVAQVFERNVPVAASRTELFPWLMALAAILLPFDVAVRRIAASFRKLLGLGRREMATVTAQRGSRMTQLMQAKARSIEMQQPVSLFDSVTPRARPAVNAPGARVIEVPKVEQPPSEVEAPSQATATAAELLRRRRAAGNPPPADVDRRDTE
jgi:hypothetical protein